MQEAISRSDANQISQEYRETLNAIFTRIKNSALFDGKKPDNKILIVVGGENVYKSLLNEEPLINKLTPENVEKLQTAINNPQDLKGAVKISIGKEIVFHAKNGQVMKDSLGLISDRKQSEKQVTREAEKPSKKDVQKTTEVKKLTIESLQFQVASLEEQAIAQQETIKSLQNKPSPTEELNELKDAISKQQKTLESIQTCLEKAIVREAPVSQNSKLQDWVGEAETKVKDTVRGIWNKVTDALTPKIDKVNNEVNNRLSNLEAKVNEINTKFNDAYRETKGKLLVECASKVLNLLGKYNEEDGSVRYESKNYLFIQKDKHLTVLPKDGRDEVLNNNGFTEAATDEDINNLQKVEKAAEQAKVENAPSQSRSLKL